ncbi:hypothetical protein FRC10_002859 [Ceratobasidium sp. 414]|nr:hypothetical protein FRC10_002859 [Ceratobasidium sp. 414]
MRTDADLPDKCWGYAILHAAFSWNAMPKRSLNGRTPEEVSSGRIPDVSQPRIFDCKAWARVPDDKHTKLEVRLLECRYLGFAPNRKAHVLAERATGRILTSRDVVFDEGLQNLQRVVIKDNGAGDWPKQVGAAEQPPVKTEEPKVKDGPKVLETESNNYEDGAEPQPRPEARTEAVAPDPLAVANLPERERGGTYVAVEEPPRSYREAMFRPDARRWLAAMME